MVAHLDAKKNVDGIICDLCGKPLIDKFEYYSGHFDLVDVDRSAGKSGIRSIDKRTLDIDLCPQCVEGIKKTMLNVIKKRESSGAWTVG